MGGWVGVRYAEVFHFRVGALIRISTIKYVFNIA